jgi:hypothetical protein
MPLTLNVGVSRKIGQPDYGSLGANCHVEVELDTALLREDLDAFHRHVRNAFLQCRQAVDDELTQAQQGESSNGHRNGHHNGTNGNVSNGNGSRRTSGRQATASQCRAIRAIADRQRLDLTAELHNRFGVEHPEDLGISQASELIDAIKPKTNGSGGRR